MFAMQIFKKFAVRLADRQYDLMGQRNLPVFMSFDMSAVHQKRTMDKLSLFLVNENWRILIGN